MLLSEAGILSLAIILIQFVSTIIISGSVVGAIVALVRGPRATALRQARQRVAEGVMLGLSLVVAATLLKTITIHSFAQLGLFAAIIALRTILKRIFTWEAQPL